MKVRTIQRGILLFWALYFLLVWITNLCDALKELGWLGKDWRYVSGNYALIVEVTAGKVGGPAWLAPVLFAGVLLWEAAAGVMFIRAAAVFRSMTQPGRQTVHAAFAAALGLWAAFILADEFFIDYRFETTHRSLLTLQLLSLLAMHLLRDDASG